MILKLINKSSSNYKEKQCRGLWKPGEEITQIRPAFSLIFSQSTRSFEKHI